MEKGKIRVENNDQLKQKKFVIKHQQMVKLFTKC